MNTFINTSNNTAPTFSRESLEPDPKKTGLVQAYHYSSSNHELPINLGSRFIIIWIKSGSLGILEHGQLRVLYAQQLLCILPGSNHKLLSTNNLEAYIISFTEDFVLMAGAKDMYPFSLHNRMLNSPGIVLLDGKATQNGDIESLIRLAIDNRNTSCQLRHEIYRGVLQVLVAYLSRGIEQKVSPQQPKGYDEQLFRRFLRLLHSEYITNKSVTQYASALAVSPNYLSEAVKRVSGHTASFHIHHHVIMVAKSAALDRRTSMKEVAYQVGFADIAHFSKFFRTHVGMNFSEYKKLLL